ISNDLVTEMLFEPRGEGLAVACKASGIGKASFTSIFAISRKTRPGGGKNLRQQTNRALSFFDMVSEDAAGKVLTRWQSGGKYLSVIRNLELGTPKK
ncbi:MAG: DUF2336 domain-containing protein, partial [Rhodospirillales bacterium]|nr:DUF2336 domain-containing protein [Rhodospirillales bacterium]